MEKSFALVLPDRPGGLREVMRILSANEVSVLRVSYNRVIDVHALFLDVFGTKSALEKATEELRAWSFLPGQREVGEIRLLELKFKSDMGILESALALVERLELNITYVDVRTDGNDGEIARLAVYVTDAKRLDRLMSDANELCPARLVPKGEQPSMLDNNHFNLSFAHGLAKRLGFSAAGEEEILINSNRIMQNLMTANGRSLQAL